MTSAAPRSRSAVWISAAAVGVFQVIGSFGATHNQPERRAMDGIALVLVLAGPAALAARDRWPLIAVGVACAAADLYVALGYGYGPIFLSVVVALFAAVQAGRRRATVLLASGGYAGYVVASAVDPRRAGGPGWAHLALVAGWLAVVLAVSEVVRIRRWQAAERERAEQEVERRRADEQRLELARELHDVLAHNISLINVQASVALHLLDEQPEQAAPALANIKDASRDALHELRTALDLLRHGDEGGAPRTPAPCLADLDALFEGVRASGLDVRVDDPRPPRPLPGAVELAAYRIVQEALTNVTRHARARAVTVRLAYGDGVTIDVADDGVGRAAAPAGTAPAGASGTVSPRGAGGNGINGMRERAGALGGTVEAGPRPGGGFRVHAHLPVRPS